MRLTRKRDQEAEDTAADAHEQGGAAHDPGGPGHDLAAAATTTTGADAPTDLSDVTPSAGPDKPARLGGRGLLAALWRAVKQFSADNLSDWAAALTYYGVLSIFPGVLVIVSVLGLIGGNGQRTVQDAAHQLAPDGQLRQLVDTVLDQVKQPGTAGVAAIVGIVLAFWSASGYVAAFMRAANAVYDVPEGRPLWKLLPVRVAVTAVVGIVLVLSAAIVVVTGGLARVIGDKVGLGSVAVTTWDIAKWPVLVVLISLVLAILYWASPNARIGGFRWVSPGGLCAVLLWALASVAFAVYLANFANYNKTYGTLGGVIAFLVWLWVSNIAILFGAELDAELERGRAIATGHDPAKEPYLQLRDDRKVKNARAARR